MSDNVQAPTDFMNYEIRCFEWIDIDRYLDQITNMQLENTYKFHYPEKRPNKDYVRRKILELEGHLKRGNTYFVGAVKNGKLYGYIWCYQSMFIDEKRMSINSLFVREDVRRTGLGQLLMNEIKKIAIKDGCDSIGTHYASFNAAAGEFYARNGFHPTRVEMVCKLNQEAINSGSS